MRALRLSLRFLHIAWVFWIAALVYLGRRIVRGRLSRDAVETLRGEVIASAFEKLGATFIKLGQILSTRPDLLGPGYTTALARLQDAVPPASFEEVREVLAAELPPEARRRLAFIDPTPIAAASVAQVHRATLDTGETIALKVQRRAAEPQI
ncbi:MAG: AarF/UbiB family protein, partial [Polyangiaceae bacterium]